MQALPWSIQNLRVSSFGLERVRGIAFRMGEEGGIEVATQAALLAEFHPFPEVLRFQFVPVRPLSVLKNRVAGVQVHLGGAGNQSQHHVQVRHQLLRRPGPAWVVAGGLDSAGQGLGGIRVKAAYIVPLPAVQGYGHLPQFLHGRAGIDSQRRVTGFRFFVTHASSASV